MRSVNNLIKKNFLNTWVKSPHNPRVLDIGCGQGGDLHKWKSLNVILSGVDPNPIAIQEAKRRSQKILPSAHFEVGTILDVVYKNSYDYICYNFSMQYEDPANYKYISSLLNPGGYLLGIVPDKTRFCYAKDDGIILKEVSENEVAVWIPDTPYYASGPVVEPMIHPENFIKNMMDVGLDLIMFGESFSIYSKFVFQKKYIVQE
jgi:SAM-dependent methyltransferase